MMARATWAPKARLKLELDNEVLLGMAGGEHVHCLVQCPSDPSAGAEIEHGVYEVMPPVEHPVLGRIAILTHLTETADTSQLGGRSSVGSAKLLMGGHAYTLTVAHAAANPALARGLTYTLSPSAVDHAMAGSPSFRGSLILTKGPLGGSNVVVVTSGFDELMDLLESSGGGTVDVMP
jgi:hypothetical protein